MRKSKLCWIVMATVLVALLVSAGCARGGWRPWWRKAPAPPPVSKRTPYQPPKVQEPSRIVDRPLVTPVEEPEARGVTFEPADLEMIHFEFDMSRITEEARITLQSNAEIIKENPGVIIQIEGHCDERGTNDYNLALGQRRARSTREYLINLGVDPGSLTTISYGEEQPLDPGHNEEAWGKNRRVQFNRAQ